MLRTVHRVLLGLILTSLVLHAVVPSVSAEVNSDYALKIALENQLERKLKQVIMEITGTDRVVIFVNAELISKEGGSGKLLEKRKENALVLPGVPEKTEFGSGQSEILLGAGSSKFTVNKIAVSMWIDKSVPDSIVVASHYHTSSEKRSVLRKCLLTVNHSLEASLLGGVLRSGEPMLIPSIQPEQLQAIFIHELASYVHEYGVHSLLVAPITGSTGVLGAVILVRDQNSKAYTLDEQNFLMDICNRTALAVENCHLFGSLRAEIEKWLQAERALENSEERFRSIFESTSLGIKILDVDGNILQTNPAFRDISGYSQTELIGRPFHQLMHPRDAVHALRLIRDLKLSGVPDFRFEHRILNRDGQVIWVKTSFTAVKT